MWKFNPLGLTPKVPLKRLNASTALTEDWKNLGTRSSSPHPPPPQKLSRQRSADGEGRRGKESVEGRTGTLGDEAAGVPVRGEAGPRTRGDQGLEMQGEAKAPGHTVPGVRGDASSG